MRLKDTVSHETKLEFLSNKHFRWVLCETKDEYVKIGFISTIKCGGESEKLRGCFSSKGKKFLKYKKWVVGSFNIHPSKTKAKSRPLTPFDAQEQSPSEDGTPVSTG